MVWALKSSLDTQLDGKLINGWKVDSWMEGLNSWMEGVNIWIAG